MSDRTEKYEKGLYLSRKIKELIRIELQTTCEGHYQPSIKLLNTYVEKWKKEAEQSKSGKILKVWHAEEDSQRILKIEIHHNHIQICVNNIPVIREYVWSDLLGKCALLHTFPNKYLQVTEPVVKLLIVKVKVPHISIIYKALLEICSDQEMDSALHTILNSAKALPTEEELSDIPTISFPDDFNYTKLIN